MVVREGGADSQSVSRRSFIHSTATDGGAVQRCSAALQRCKRRCTSTSKVVVVVVFKSFCRSAFVVRRSSFVVRRSSLFVRRSSLMIDVRY